MTIKAEENLTDKIIKKYPVLGNEIYKCNHRLRIYNINREILGIIENVIYKKIYQELIDMVKRRKEEEKHNKDKMENNLKGKMEDNHNENKKHTVQLNPNKQFLLPFEEQINKWIDDNNICKNADKKRDLFWDIFQCIIDSEIELHDYIDIINICDKNDIIIEEGNIWDKLKLYFKDNHIKFLKFISNKCPRALSSSPNADCGKWELFYRLIRPKSRQPNKGDIYDNNVKLDLKGEEVRLFANKTGKKYIKDTNKIFKFKDITGNIVKKGGLKGSEQFEIEKTQYRDHYKEQFRKDISKSKSLIREYMAVHSIEYSEDELEQMFKDDIWDQSILHKLWLKKMYKDTMKNNGCEKLIIFGNGSNVKILDSIDKLKNFRINNDYFRINQLANIGFYII